MPSTRLRLDLLFAVAVCVFALLAARLVQVQLFEHTDFAAQALDQHRRQVERLPDRGRIYDRNLRLLATTVPTPSIFVNPAQLPNPRHAAHVLTRSLSIDANALYQRLSLNPERQFAWVKRRIPPQEHQAFLSLTPVQRTGMYLRWEPKRQYPLGRLASHVLGLVDVDGLGRLGVERTFQDRLAGKPGRDTLARDGNGLLRVVDPSLQEPPVNGYSLVLTLDANIQEILEEEISLAFQERQPTSITAIVMHTETGEILALANLPNFDPNNPGLDPSSALLNRAIQARYEPGSTFKPFILAATIEESLVQLDDRMFCYNGVYRTGHRVLHDHHPYDWLTTAEIVVKSSNIGIARIGELLGPDRLQHYLRIFRIPERTNIELPGEVAGRITPPGRWSYYSTTSVPMGHELAVTPIRLLTAFNALANDGVLVEPRIVKAVVDDELRVLDPRPPAPPERVVSSRTASLLLHNVLTLVVEEGTGTRAKIDRWTLAGKTGTAQKVLEDGTYSHSLYVSSFLCIAPAEQPVVSMLVLFDGPTQGSSFYGGSVAAPVAGRVAQRILEYLDVDPSDTLTPNPVAQLSPRSAGDEGV